jgi:citrate lyase subunit beta/citryl-CoA lyase
MPMRSALFVPADRPERIGKALASGADAVIVDLEDAVAPSAKEGARAALARWLATPEGSGPVLVRVNAPGTPWFADDLASCRAPRVQGVVVPKAESAGQLAEVAATVPGRALFPLVETAAGIDAVEALARAPGVQRLLFGSIDLQADLGILGEGEELLYFRARLVLAARLASLAPPLDGVTTAIDDAALLRADAQRARRLGFGGKLCIHPRQVAGVNEAFTPSPQELDWARRVLAAAEASGGAAVAVDGKMVDAPVLLRARALLAQAPAA